jgi:hypothetical protein
MSGLSLLADAMSKGPVSKKRQRDPIIPTHDINVTINQSAQILDRQQAKTTLERSVRQQHHLDAVAPPVPKSLNLDSRNVLRRIFNKHEQNGMLNQQQMRCVRATFVFLPCILTPCATGTY